MNLISIKEAAAFLRGSDGYLLYTHANPDGDTIGSAVALALSLRKIGKKVSVFSVDGIPEKLSFLNMGDLFITSENTENLIPISIDVAGPQMLGNCNNKNFVLAIDHHKVNTIQCENLLVMSDRIACGEIIYMLMQEMKIELDYDIAVALYTAICSDSGGFRYEATKAETHIIAAKCLEQGIDFAEINRKLFESKTLAQVALTKMAYKNLELLQDGKFAIVGIRREEMVQCNAEETDFDCINSIPREIGGVLASAVIRPKGDGAKISMRSNADIDVAQIASQFGGGGHYHAAGFSIDGGFDQALEIVRKIFSEIKI